VYFYYALENRPRWFRLIWASTDFLRRFISRCPHSGRLAITQIIAATLYYPLARISLVAEMAGLSVDRIPLSFYRTKSFYTIRTDSLDRFGTSLEQRFTAKQIRAMMTSAGLGDIKFSDRKSLLVRHWVPRMLTSLRFRRTFRKSDTLTSTSRDSGFCRWTLDAFHCFHRDVQPPAHPAAAL
jgi:hypothetical protein